MRITAKIRYVNDEGGFVRFASIGVVLFWALMMAFLVKQTYFERPHITLDTSYLKELREREEWLGIYWQDRKIGYALSRVMRRGSGYELYDSAVMDLTMMGTPQRVQSTSYSIVNPDFSLSSFNFRLRSGMVKFKLVGEVIGNDLHVQVDTGNEVTNKTIPLTEPLYLFSNVKPFLLAQGIEVGKQYEHRFFDPSTMSYTDVYIEVEGKEVIEIDGQEIPGYRLSQSFRGIRVRTWINEEGDTLKEESPMGFMLVREGKEAAITKNWSSGGPDITVASAVPASRRIAKENPSYLKVRLKGIDLGQFSMSGGRQKVTGDVLEVRQEDRGRMKSYILPYTGEDLAPYLSDTLLIQSRHPKVIAQARDTLGAEEDALQAVQRIGAWMEDNIEKKPTMSLPSALEVLETKVGDCNEHATLFAALARSVGIPTRVVAGIVYFEGSFFYHAWNEVYLGDWVAYDPLINELPADATHIKLIEGGLDKQLDILKVVGLLSIDILEYS